MQRKRSRKLAWLLLLIASSFPLLLILAKLTGYSVKVENGVVYALLTTALYWLCGGMLLQASQSEFSEKKSETEEKPDRLRNALLCITLFVSLLNIFVFSAYVQSMSAIALEASWFLLTAWIVLTRVRSVWVRVICLLPLIVFSGDLFFIFLMGQIGETAVLASEASPDGRYCAEVLDHDEGALGGSTGLYVYRIPGTFSVGSFSFRRDYEEVARGDWNTFEILQWQDETHVVYNGRVYEIVP